MIDFTSRMRGGLRAKLCCRQVSNVNRQGQSEILTIGTSCVMRPCLSLLLVKQSSGLSRACTAGCLEIDPNLKSSHWISE